jgi:hypothetical protein
VEAFNLVVMLHHMFLILQNWTCVDLAFGGKNMKACTERASPHYLQYEMRASASASASIPKLALY